MVLIQHVIPATPGAPERVECEAATESSASSPPKLLRSLAAVEARAATAKDKSHLRETYLVESGAHLRALKCLEANLGRTAQADARGSVYSHDVLEGYLRCRFMARAPRPPEAAARARRGARAGRPGRAADVLLARGRAPGRRPRVRGRGDRPIARAQVYDKTGKGGHDRPSWVKNNHCAQLSLVVTQQQWTLKTDEVFDQLEGGGPLGRTHGGVIVRTHRLAALIQLIARLGDAKRPIHSAHSQHPQRLFTALIGSCSPM